ncbi:hypothetical protein KQX54_007455 [Cotesia glomerata]|uniref:Uncharacterized protein n=1 Tax=Cotesia glomerata TaxID=32391 RepID=A0AAV7I227_COTGL|nr:hypothetical protein KQX54_007455 [Cotesia glomerata]
MADDPNRDYLPREHSYVESYQSVNVLQIDPRERLTISKLNRDVLEDKYLRLVEEYQKLKKLCNINEDKIKRLTTKLMRISASPSRPFSSSTLNINNDKDRIASLMLEVNKLKEKIHVYRTQLLSHGILRSSSQMRRLPNCNSSGTTTFRSEGGRIKLVQCPNFIEDGEENTDNLNERIEELEGQKKTLINRVKELENKLSIAKNENQKEKITENIEYIRVWRQMKLQQEKLTEFESKNKLLLEEIEDLKSCLCEAKKSCSPTAKLVEKKLMGELEEQIARSQSYQAALREKDEQVRDLTSEIKILQQHNSELIGISTKYSQVEIENMELKKQLGDMMTDNHNIKCACNQEQANVKALQAANAQLIDKLQELQRNNDLMSIQLKSPKGQKEKADKTNYESQSPRDSPKKSNYCQECNSKKIRSKNVDDDVNKSRNEYELPIENTYVECGSQTDVFPERDYVRFENNGSNKNLEDFGGNKSDKPGNLSPEAMLKLLDDAQINTPLDAQNVAKIRLLEGLSPNHYGDTSNRQRQEPDYPQDFNDSEHNKFIETICDLVRDYWKINCSEKSKIDHRKVQQSFLQYFNNLFEKPSTYSDQQNTIEYCKCLSSNSSDDQWTQNIQLCPAKSKKAISQTKINSELRMCDRCTKINNCNFDDKNDTEFSPISISDQEGLVEIRILSFHPSIFAVNNFFMKYNSASQPSLFLSCDFCHEESISTSTIKYPQLNFNSSYVYRVSNLTKFFNCLLNDYIYFQLYSFYRNVQPHVIAQGKMNVRNILDHPQEKLNYFVSMDCPPCYHCENFGKLSLWIRLSCDVDKVKKYRQKKCLDKNTFDVNSSVSSHKKVSPKKSLPVPQEQDSYKNNEMTLKSSKTPSAKQSPHNISQSKSSFFELPKYESTKYEENLHESKLISTQASLNNSLVKEEKKSYTSINDFSKLTDDKDYNETEVTIKNYSDESFRNLSNQINEDDNVIIIKISRLKLYKNCPLLKNPDIRQLYIEFSFLGYRGSELETKSVPKPRTYHEEMYFNYKKKFKLDEKENPQQWKKLRAMLTGAEDPNIQFKIVSEPLEGEHEKDCVEVGCAYFDLKKQTGSHDVFLAVTNLEETNAIGVLKVL